jgi:histidine triad (HIT) family protein
MTDPTANCLFCRILRGEIPAKKVYENEHVLAFEDIDPKAPTHVLVIPKKHFAGLKEAQAEDAEVIGRCHLAAAEIARQRKIENGYRTVLNVGPGAGQSVFHLHVHLLGGRSLGWPPGLEAAKHVGTAALGCPRAQLGAFHSYRFPVITHHASRYFSTIAPFLLPSG